MKRWIGLSALSAVVLFAGGCKKSYDMRFQPVSLSEPVTINFEYMTTKEFGTATTLNPGQTKGAKFVYKVDAEDASGEFRWMAVATDGRTVSQGSVMLNPDVKQPIYVRVDQYLSPGMGRPGDGSRDPNATGSYEEHGVGTERSSGRSGGGTRTTVSEPEMVVGSGGQ